MRSPRTFADPLEVHRWARTETPDLALVDYQMPGRDGVELTRRFRQISHCAPSPCSSCLSADRPVVITPRSV
ncbi:MAG: response regulator [Deferrisomatales bacterium]